jgi:succinate-semialdehyde dehydrogenase/glutarate-semialdehyde dehydrogenase
METLRLFIAGAWREGRGAARGTVLRPATGAPVAQFRHADARDLEEALAAAARAAPAWRALAPLERSRILREAARRVASATESIAAAITREEGKPLAEARQEVARAVEVFDWYAEEGRRAYGRVIPSRAGTRMQVLREPVGPVAAFTPWNFPVMTPARKIAGALAAGCPCIIKPAEETPSACLALAEALQQAGLPDGVLQVVLGDPAAICAQLVASPVIRRVSFTGSTAVGRRLGAEAAAAIKRATMELGGHAPVLVLADANIDAAAALSVASKHRNAGQICVSPTRFFVARAACGRFVEAWVERARALRLGDGAEPATQMGPLANARRVAAIERLVHDARRRGARVACGGERVRVAGCAEGFFHAPTLIVDADDACDVMNEEPFGPVATVTPFDTLDEALARANRLPYGLAAYAFTQDARAMMRLADELQTGMLSFNAFAVSVPEAPFGGVKDSGYGSEGGVEGLDAYLATKFVHQC